MSNTQDCVECQPDRVDVGQQTSEPETKEDPVEVKNDTVVAPNPLDPATFEPPTPLPTPSISIEFCDRVRSSIV